MACWDRLASSGFLALALPLAESKPVCIRTFLSTHYAAGSRSLSRATEDSLTWSLVLLGSAVGGLRPAVAAPLVPSLEALVDDALKV